ncbi:13515_t:CDS:2 [Acaulospora morrowiae]|uniref:13515_t:CDS:1 n=1 Tax=Acaulospora morrowiae TaxID=94023 RepID=A0A9N9AZM4_9GLOM|nr:13515_t:CDS:2 [Acaulospora morrowiae]
MGKESRQEKRNKQWIKEKEQMGRREETNRQKLIGRMDKRKGTNG